MITVATGIAVAVGIFVAGLAIMAVVVWLLLRYLRSGQQGPGS